jgi:hypothetical protein
MSQAVPRLALPLRHWLSRPLVGRGESPSPSVWRRAEETSTCLRCVRALQRRRRIGARRQTEVYHRRTVGRRGLAPLRRSPLRGRGGRGGGLVGERSAQGQLPRRGPGRAEVLGDSGAAGSILEWALASNGGAYGPQPPSVATDLSKLAIVLQDLESRGRHTRLAFPLSAATGGAPAWLCCGPIEPRRGHPSLPQPASPNPSANSKCPREPPLYRPFLGPWRCGTRGHPGTAEHECLWRELPRSRIIAGGRQQLPSGLGEG